MIYTNDVSGLIALKRTRKAVTKKKNLQIVRIKKRFFLFLLKKEKWYKPFVYNVERKAGGVTLIYEIN